MILGYTNEEILKEAIESHSQMADGVVQYDYQTGKLAGAAFTTGTIENPANPLIEIFRLPQGEPGEFDCKCHETGDCPFWIVSDDDFAGGHFDDDMIDEYGSDRITCCMNGSLEDWDLEEDIREDVELQIREVLSDYLGDTISKLNEIRVAISDIVAPYDYFNVRQDDWEMRVLDIYVDNAYDYGLALNDYSAFDMLESEMQWLIASCEYSDNEYLQKAGALIEAHKLDEALECLK